MIKYIYILFMLFVISIYSMCITYTINEYNNILFYIYFIYILFILLVISVYSMCMNYIIIIDYY